MNMKDSRAARWSLFIYNFGKVPKFAESPSPGLSTVSSSAGIFV